MDTSNRLGPWSEDVFDGTSTFLIHNLTYICLRKVTLEEIESNQFAFNCIEKKCSIFSKVTSLQNFKTFEENVQESEKTKN